MLYFCAKIKTNTNKISKKKFISEHEQTVRNSANVQNTATVCQRNIDYIN